MLTPLTCKFCAISVHLLRMEVVESVGDFNSENVSGISSVVSSSPYLFSVSEVEALRPSPSQWSDGDEIFLSPEQHGV